MYPVMLNVENRSCLVVGGGGVALRKVEGLLQDGALVTVVAGEPVANLVALAAEERVTLLQRSYRAGEAAEYSLAFAATDDREVNRRVFEDAKAENVWVNVADDPELCSFHLPARLQRGSMQIALASAGEAPFVVRRMRKLLERRFGLEWSEWVEAAARFRTAVREAGLEGIGQEKCFDLFFENTVNATALKARVPTEGEEAVWLQLGGAEAEKAEGLARRTRGLTRQGDGAGHRAGLVSLVGSGPGDAGLLTVRGRQRLMAADTVVYDQLALTAIPCDLPARVELRPVGKSAGNHPVPQDEINAMLIREARKGKRVVRLKGGDPYVFGRGGEEAEALVEADVPFEVVPSVTAGVAVPAYAGIPVTHRREVVRVTMVTAHESAKEEGPSMRWDLLAPDDHATLVGYMGVTSLPNVVQELLDSGMDPKTPAAMIERGTTSGQRSIRSSVAELPEAVRKAGIRPPALFVIGPAVRHAEQLDWFGKRPLHGQRLVVMEGAGGADEQLELAGAELLQLTLPVTPAARIVMGALPLTGCLVDSPEQVDALDEERDGPGWSDEVVCWCVSRSAAERARALGWARVEELPAGGDATQLAEELKGRLHDS